MSAEQEQQLRQEFTNYERTVWLVNCIEGHLTKYYASHVQFFDRYPKIPMSDSPTSLTPDFTVVFSGPYEIVGEVKRALGRNDRLEENFEQLKSYDGELSLRVQEGEHYTHTTSNHDILVLVNLEYANADAKKLQSLVEAERAKGKFDRAVSVFSATNDGQQAKPRWIMVWQEKSDRFRDCALPAGSRLSERHQENNESIVVYPDSFAGVQSVHWFCNDNPPTIYIAVMLWAKIFPRMMSDLQREDWIESDCQGTVNINTTVQAICDLTRKILGYYLKKSVMKSVLTILRKAQLVTKATEENYVVHFRRFRPSRYGSDSEDRIEELKLDHQREGMIRAIVKGDQPGRPSGYRIPGRSRKSKTDKNQPNLL